MFNHPNANVVYVDFLSIFFVPPFILYGIY